MSTLVFFYNNDSSIFIFFFLHYNPTLVFVWATFASNGTLLGHNKYFSHFASFFVVFEFYISFDFNTIYTLVYDKLLKVFNFIFKNISFYISDVIF